MRFLNEREEIVLRTIIDEFIDSNEPVGSRNVSKHGPLKMSAATIRNIMSDLVDKGFIAQPHTSAGRVPTDSGYRYYIDRLASMQHIHPDFANKMQSELALEPANVMNMFRDLSKRIGKITNSIGFVVSPKINAVNIKHIEFIRINKENILTIVVTNTGIVQNILLPVDKSLTDSDLVQIANYLNANLSEHTLLSIKQKLAHELIHSEGEILRLQEKAEKIGDILWNNPALQEELIFEGTDNLIDIPEFQGSSKLRDVVQAFEQKQNICSLLDRCMTESGVQIFIGSEIGMKETEELGMVIKPYSRGGNIIGTIGVIGPKRMRYPQVASIVDYSAKLISGFLDDYYGGEEDE